MKRESNFNQFYTFTSHIHINHVQPNRNIQPSLEYNIFSQTWQHIAQAYFLCETRD